MRQAGVKKRNAVMASVDFMLAQWRSLYCEWVLAELELRSVHQRRPGSRQEAALEARVRELREQCQSVLDKTTAALSSSSANEPVYESAPVQQQAAST